MPSIWAYPMFAGKVVEGEASQMHGLYDRHVQIGNAPATDDRITRIAGALHKPLAGVQSRLSLRNHQLVIRNHAA
jgi:hypothetical protein